MYVGLSLLSSPRGFLGTDTGGKVATLRVMTEAGRFDPDVGYWAERWDPDGSLHPLGYTVRTTSGRWVNVTTIPALWLGWQLYRFGGYRAALLVPMLGAVAAAAAGVALLRRLGADERTARRGFWLLGLASPLAIYALDFWEHTLGVALMAWGVVALADALVGRGRAWWRATAAGSLFGVAATMRTESFVYLAVAGAAWGVLSSARRVPLVRVAALGVVVLAAAAVPVVANEVVERAVVGSAIRSGRVAETARTAADAPGTRVEEAATTMVGLEGSVPGIAVGALAVALLAFAARRRTDPGLAVVAVAGAGVLAAVRFVGSGLGFVPGLGPAWVWPAAAVAAPEGGRSVRRAGAALASAGRRPAGDRADASIGSTADGTVRDVRRLVLAVALGAVPIVLATQFRGGAAPQWAGRYLLVSGFLLTMVGALALVHGRSRRLQAAFAALAVAVTATGVAWLAVRSHEVARTVATLERRPEPVLVSSLYHLVREGGATYGDHRWLTLTPGAGGGPDDAAAVLAAAGIDRFASIQPEAARPLAFPGFEPVGRSSVRLFEDVDLRVTSWRRSS